MPRSIQCTECGVVLNLPPGAEGRRLKCPRCGCKFQAGGTPAEGALPAKGPGASGIARDPNADSTLELTKRNSGIDLPMLPMAEGDLRETFDLPMMTEADARSLPIGLAMGGADGKSETADALALFEEKRPAPKKKTGAEARAEARRCPTCGSVVPRGMSICQRCGLDLESGTRVDLTDDLTPPPPPKPGGPPITIAIVGGLCAAASVAAAGVAGFKWMREVPGALYFVPVAMFGVYASVQFLRGKTAKLLLVALTIGAVIDLAAFVALPIYESQANVTVVESNEVDENTESAGEAIASAADRLDTNKVATGFGLLFLYAVTSIYLMSPQVKRYVMRH